MDRMYIKNISFPAVMELSEFVAVLTGASLGFVLTVNTKTYRDTKEWHETHPGIDDSWEKESYKEFRDRCGRGFITYYLGYPGRKFAYMLHSDKKQETE